MDVEIRFRDVEEETNVGLISAWVNGEQVGSLTFGWPMRSHERNYDLVLGWCVVIEGWQRQGIASLMLDCFFLWADGRSVYAEYTKTGRALMRSYSAGKDLNIRPW